MARGNLPEIWDYLDFMLLRMAKLKRLALSNPRESAAFYNDFFTDKDVSVLSSGCDLRRQIRASVLREAARANMPPGAQVLDVGCGVGDNLQYILQDGAEFYGLEYAERTAQTARTVLRGRAVVCVGSAKQIPLPSSRFDLVLCIEVLEHIDDDSAAIREIARVLKPGGALILSVPFRYWFPYYLRAMGHFRHYTRTDVVQLLDAAGLRIERFLPNFPRWSRFANYAYITCRLYAMLAALVGIRRLPTEIRTPFSNRTLMSVLFATLEPLRRREAALPYATLETSTFVLARKRVAALE